MFNEIRDFLTGVIGKKNRQGEASIVSIKKINSIVPSNNAIDVVPLNTREITSNSRDQFLSNFGLFFSPDNDRLWKEWVEAKDYRDEGDLRRLLEQDNISDSFKARAIYLLLVPDMLGIDRNPDPVFWNRKLYPLCREEKIPKNLSPILLSFAAGLIVLFLPKVKELRDPSDSFTFHFYCSTMVNLMCLIPLAEAKKLLMYFPLNNYKAWADWDNSSGYFPFSVLIDRKEIPDELKFLAAEKMKEIIRSEQEGRTKPREWYENALKCFADIIQLHLSGNSDLPFGVKFFAEQMGFLVGINSSDVNAGVPDGIERYHRHDISINKFLKPKTDKQIIRSFHIEKILSILSGDRYKELRYKIVRFVVFENGKEKFEVLGIERLDTAKIMLKEIEGSGDKKLIAALNEIIAKGEKYIFGKAKQGEGKKSKEQQLLVQMA